MKKLLTLTVTLLLTAALLVSCGNTDKAPDGYQYVTDNDACKYSMLVPEAWHVKNDSKSDFSSATVSTNDTCNISMALVPLYTSTSIADYWASQLPTYQAIFGNTVEVVSQGTNEQGEPVEWEKVEVADTFGYRYIFTARFEETEYKIMQIFFFDMAFLTADMYAFTYTATADHYDTHLEAVSDAIKTIQFDN